MKTLSTLKITVTNTNKCKYKFAILSPIHAAALKGDINGLRRQVIIFGARKLDINIKSIEIQQYSEAETGFPKNVLRFIF